MKSAKISWREVLAVLIAVAACTSVVLMFNAEGGVLLQGNLATPQAIVQEFNAHILPAIRKYSLAIGALLLAVSVAYILLGAEEDISTRVDE